MRTIRTTTRIALGAIALLGATALPAQAATTGDTSTTFTITGGSLTITAPATANLGSTTAGSVMSSQLGNVTVSDLRAVLSGSWTATVASTAFTTGGGTASETVPASAESYMSGAATASTGSATFLQGQVSTPSAMSAAVTAFTANATAGNNSVTWNPTITVAVPPQAVAGAYRATVTHSVS